MEEVLFVGIQVSITESTNDLYRPSHIVVDLNRPSMVMADSSLLVGSKS